MAGDDLRVPLEGSTLIVGPSNAGKTTLTARTLDRWLESFGPDGVVVLEFGPEFERAGRVLGRRLSRFVTVPDGVWSGVLEARAPRAEGATDAEVLELARGNAAAALDVMGAAPEAPTAVFVNDATIPFQHPDTDPGRLMDYCDRAECAVLNALESDELGTADAVSRTERGVVGALRAWADRVVDLGDDPTGKP